ncbi:MAG TPA: hypothetical protein DCS19_04170 [Flavobacterium sp.]|nr:hypothetical protein [Flavobacterium sp.]
MWTKIIEFLKPSVAVPTQEIIEIIEENNDMPTWVKSILIKILGIIPIYTILDVIITWVEEKAEKTATEWDDTVCEFLRSAVEILKDKKFPTVNDAIKYPEIK